MKRHDCTVYGQGDRENATRNHPRHRWYMACSCGWVAPLRRTCETAEDDAVAHVVAVGKKRLAA